MNLVSISFLGSCGEVGRSAIKITSNGESILVDYGVVFNRYPHFPKNTTLNDLQGIVLTHAHLDHTGALPLIFASREVPVYATRTTHELKDMLITDMMHISGYYLPFERAEFNRLRLNSVNVEYNKPFSVGSQFTVTLFNAGHIPGSAMVLVEADGKRILVTGDINTESTRLLNGNHKDLSDLDVIITESTYATVELPNRPEVEQALVDKVIETRERGGVVLIPAFAVGRSQEVMMILDAFNISGDIYLDGMARMTNSILEHNPVSLRDFDAFEKALSNVKEIENSSERYKAIFDGSIIISPAGMLKGGASKYYFKKLYADKKNLFVLVSYQIEGTPGHELLTTGSVRFNGTKLKVKAEIASYHLSSHVDGPHLVNFLESIAGDAKIFIVHGEPESNIALYNTLRTKGINSEIPGINQTIEL